MDRPTVLAYYFPDWHKDPRNEEWFGPGWDEWELVHAARPRFPGHRQPRVPLNGTFDEATPEAAADQIRLAKEYGVDGFLVDYYWYDDGPYLQGALDDGLLAAENSADIKFALMWANHELINIFPHDDPRNSGADRLKDGAIDRSAFERMAHHVIEKYFSCSNHLTVDGRPWFTIYDVGGFIAGMGGASQAIDALDWFRGEVRKAGFPGLHLNAVIKGSEVLPTAITAHVPSELVEELGFDSATSYVWVHHADIRSFDFPISSIEPLRESAFRQYDGIVADLDIPFYPNVTVGWDSSPRTRQDIDFERGRYPWTTVWDPTPEQFSDGLRAARDFIERHQPEHPMITINAWNEWTEGSVLLPDTHNGYQYLEAVRKIFGVRE